MANAVIVLVLVMVCIFAVRSYFKKLSHGCCGAGGDFEEKRTVSDKNPAHYPYQTELKIDGMTCKNCKARVENAFHAEDGLWAQVDLPKGLALVRSKHPFEERELCRLVSRAGYHVAEINEEPPKFIV